MEMKPTRDTGVLYRHGAQELMSGVRHAGETPNKLTAVNDDQPPFMVLVNRVTR